ncbi:MULTISPECIES: hypothetical protein [unclassified Micromonospora]|uniref:hypothetical protein n=1 Tax=unclassified Micromonospora TaxID=2617518 RepID=UPI0003EECDA5|nr:MULTISPECIES: hypothetical protein [unclassified Micromonospora]EWM64342.1 hypothetical protein MCBG_01475 [Micromonospora sp. M42]MCK1810214.1 hypothetical protein [Micromonospora sp. R42106]MCK1835529.1 hypothetical protein [Micromonospora sp. R42003]MCK1847460.1 hypothetical protein [Micromonospora sp. R42004]MCM1015311.1 hypothetical protein [Micromonospora sp. XM-20-01]
MNRRNAHTHWCGRDHRCGLGEHRSPEIVVDIPGHARAVLVRVRTAAGREHAEVRVRVALAPGELAARRQLVGLLGDLREAVTRAALTARPRPRRAAR